MTRDTVNVLAIPQAREIAGKLAGKILDVPRMYQVGTCLVLCPFPCNVLVMHRPGTLALAPSDIITDTLKTLARQTDCVPPSRSLSTSLLLNAHGGVPAGITPFNR